MNYDGIVIGAGPNGLTTAAYLARTGRRILVVEARDRVGGLAAPEEFSPGYWSPGLLHDTTGVRSAVVEELELHRHGLRWREENVPVFVPATSGAGLVLHRDPERAAAEISMQHAGDADRYRELRSFLERIRPLIAKAFNRAVLPLSPTRVSDYWQGIQSALELRRLGPDDLHEVLRILPMSIANWLNEWFQSDLLKAGLAHPSLAGTRMGPLSSGTVFTFLVEESLANCGVEDGPGKFIDAVYEACREGGVEFRLSTPVRRIGVASGRVTGVVLADGAHIASRVVAASSEPRHTLLDLISVPDLPPSLGDAIHPWRSAGTTAKLHLALAGALEFSGRPGEVFEAIRVGESLTELERAADAAKYREVSAAPLLDIRVPTLSTPRLAPAGHHVVSILVHFAPYQVNGGWTDSRKSELQDRVVDRLAAFAPTLRDRLVAVETLTPVDLEERYSLTGGHIYHGEHSLDQLFLQRPSPECSGHHTPIRGLYLCGSGTHPGGGVTGAPGRLAARQIAKRQKW